MHIAICDDNTADRHQLERLLKRESDKRVSTTGPLYIDSFGNCNALFCKPIQYDAAYIDICKTEGVTGIDVATRLLAKNANTTIIMCCSDIDYRKCSSADNILFLNKPIDVTELSDTISHVLHRKEQSQSLIELREDQNTVYVTEPDIFYAVQSGRYVIITLQDGRKLHVGTDISNLFKELEKYPTFMVPSKKTLINGRHISKLGFFKAIMSDGTGFRIPGDCMKYARTIFEKYH